jgi:pimeloyl-ACP methyl ester carboxylesterase
MNLRFTRSGLVIVGLCAAIALSLGVLGRFFGRPRLRFTYLTGALPAAEYTGLASEPGWSASRLTVAPGIGLNGLVRRPKAADAPWVLFYQGNDAAMLRVGQAFLNRLGVDRDWGLAVFAYRGYDSSDGSAHLAELAADAPVIVEQLCATEHVNRGRLHIVGFSIGGHLAVRAMGVAATLQPKPASLTLLAAVNDIVMVPRSFYQKLDPGDDFQTEPFLDAIPAPVLVVQGTADEALMGPGQGQAISARLGARAKYLELSGVGHVALMSNPAAVAATQEFIAAHSK